ncbi:hypothetical protein, partial [Enterococcus gallinarum]|uniref:hypothetical protein n=1 Tax=Enterococcus gallinarum TaxID=1353 RepID=UPI0032E44044
LQLLLGWRQEELACLALQANRSVSKHRVGTFLHLLVYAALRLQLLLGWRQEELACLALQANRSVSKQKEERSLGLAFLFSSFL